MLNSYFTDLLKVLAFAAAVATLPLFAAFAKLQPPWPPAIEYLSAVFILMGALAMWEWGRAASRRFRRGLMIAGIAFAILGIGAYLPVYSLYVETVPDSQERVVRGTRCTQQALLVYANACPDLDSGALASAGWDSERLWTRESIMQVRISLVAAWLSFMAGLISFIGAVVAGRAVGGADKPQ